MGASVAAAALSRWQLTTGGGSSVAGVWPSNPPRQRQQVAAVPEGNTSAVFAICLPKIDDHYRFRGLVAPVFGFHYR
jgi:hypothetical protein